MISGAASIQSASTSSRRMGHCPLSSHSNTPRAIEKDRAVRVRESALEFSTVRRTHRARMLRAGFFPCRVCPPSLRVSRLCGVLTAIRRPAFRDLQEHRRDAKHAEGRALCLGSGPRPPRSAGESLAAAALYGPLLAAASVRTSSKILAAISSFRSSSRQYFPWDVSIEPMWLRSWS